MEQVNTMTDDIMSATNEHEASTRQINQALALINDMASLIQYATAERRIFRTSWLCINFGSTVKFIIMTNQQKPNILLIMADQLGKGIVDIPR